MLTGVVVFIFPGDAAQIAVTIVITFFFFVFSEVRLPYADPLNTWHEDPLNTWLSRSGHIVVLTAFYIALLNKVDVSSERESSQTAFGWVLIVLHFSLGVMLVVNTIYQGALMHFVYQYVLRYLI